MGSILTPLLFILYINDIPESLSSPAEIFADDMLIYNYCPPSQTSITTQESLDKVTDWCGSWLLRTNADKCESMKFTRARSPSTCNYIINSKLLPKYLHTNILGWFFPVIYLGNPTYCLLLQDRTDYWAYSSGHLDLTLRLYLLVIDPWSVQYSSTLVKRGILTKHIWLKNLNACKGTLQDGSLVKTLRMKTDWNPWN